MTPNERQTLKRLVTDLAPFVTALERQSRSTRPEVAASASEARTALQAFVVIGLNAALERKCLIY